MLMYNDASSCVNCNSKDKLVDVSGHELRILTTDGSFIRPRYWICKKCLNEFRQKRGKPCVLA